MNSQDNLTLKNPDKYKDTLVSPDFSHRPNPQHISLLILIK